MVLLHGFTNDWQAWRPVIPALEERFAVFAPTLPGHFGGEPFDDGRPLSIVALTDMLERQLDARGIEKAHFVGNSLGGWLSLELAVRGRALSVTGVCPAGGWETRSREERATYLFFRRTMRTVKLSSPLFEAIASRPHMRAIAFRDMVSYPAHLSAEAALACMEAVSNCAIAGDLLAASKAGTLFGELGPIECPVTIAMATKDRVLKDPGYFTKLRRLLPDANWTTLDGLGHLPMTDDPNQVTGVILNTAL
jgi:pimeloyl-ACP methyl ester carboxylesterase